MLAKGLFIWHFSSFSLKVWHSTVLFIASLQPQFDIFFYDISDVCNLMQHTHTHAKIVGFYSVSEVFWSFFIHKVTFVRKTRKAPLPELAQEAKKQSETTILYLSNVVEWEPRQEDVSKELRHAENPVHHPVGEPLGVIFLGGTFNGLDSGETWLQSEKRRSSPVSWKWPRVPGCVLWMQVIWKLRWPRRHHLVGSMLRWHNHLHLVHVCISSYQQTQNFNAEANFLCQWWAQWWRLHFKSCFLTRYIHNLK